MARTAAIVVHHQFEIAEVLVQDAEQGKLESLGALPSRDDDTEANAGSHRQAFRSAIIATSVRQTWSTCASVRFNADGRLTFQKLVATRDELVDAQVRYKNSTRAFGDYILYGKLPDED